MTMIATLNHANDVIIAAIPLALPLLEGVIRLVPSKGPLSLLTLAAQFFHGMGTLCTTVAGGLDSVIPQKLATAAEHEAPSA